MTTFYPTPEACDLCSAPFGDVMYDAKTKAGPWGCMCPTCFHMDGVGELGTGKGQRYERGEDGLFHKTDG